MVAVFHLRPLPRTMGNRGVLLGNQTDAPAGRFPRDERKRHQVADMDRLARLSAPAPHGMAGRLGKVVPETFYPRQGDALESTESSGFVQACRGGRKRRVAAGQTVRRSVAVRLRRHLNRKPHI